MSTPPNTQTTKHNTKKLDKSGVNKIGWYLVESGKRCSIEAFMKVCESIGRKGKRGKQPSEQPGSSGDNMGPGGDHLGKATISHK